MNALSLYVTTCRRVFESDTNDNSAWADIYRLLSLLRQALSCNVCSNLLVIPMTSTVSTCQHSVCKACLGKKMRLKPSCPGCKNYNKFAENSHLRILLQCYKKFCDYLGTSSLQRKWGSLNGGTNVNFQDIVAEGSNLADNYRYGQQAVTARASSRTALPASRNVNGDSRTRRSVASNGDCTLVRALGKGVKATKGGYC